MKNKKHGSKMLANRLVVRLTNEQLEIVIRRQMYYEGADRGALSRYARKALVGEYERKKK